MKTKAAIATAAGKPLEIVTLDLDGPKAGEVLIQIKASGVCHTDEFTRSGADPEGKSLNGRNHAHFAKGSVRCPFCTRPARV